MSRDEQGVNVGERRKWVQVEEVLLKGLEHSGEMDVALHGRRVDF